MHPWLRRLLVWLVALALPVQGMAGVARMHCAAAVLPAAVHAAAGVHPADHAHAAAHAAAAGHHHAAPAADPGDDAAPTSVAHKCSACAACTLGAALPAAAAALPHAEPDGTAATAAVLPALTFIASGPERPPRSLRA